MQFLSKIIIFLMSTKSKKCSLKDDCKVGNFLKRKLAGIMGMSTFSYPVAKNIIKDNNKH